MALLSEIMDALGEGFPWELTVGGERAFIPVMAEAVVDASSRYGWNLEIEGYYDQEVPWR